MQSFGTPFGAFGTAKYSRGSSQSVLDQYVGDCPVPEPDLFLGGTSAGRHYAWCDCVYDSDPALRALCKLRLGDTMPNGDVYGDPSMPWNVTGKRTRGLTNDLLGQALQAAMRGANQVVRDAQADIEAGRDPTERYGPAGSVVVDDQSTHPAQPLVSPNQSLQTTRDAFIAAPQGSLTKAISKRTAEQLGRTIEPGFDFDFSIANTGTNKMLVAGAVAFGVWYFLIREPKRSVSGFGGYRRRRSRRLRLR